MRQRLLDATVECLVEYGFAGTTTSLVAQRAGVTRGAQIHHFRTKNDLVAAAVRHLAVQRANIAFDRMEGLRQAEDVLDAALDLLWEIHQGPMFTATVELWVASRTDPELREQMRQMEPMVDASVLSFGEALIPHLARDTRFRHWVYTVMDAIRGILISGVLFEQDELEQHWQRAKRHLRGLAQRLDEQPADQAEATGPTPPEND
ncbi:TetR/AcrR family transcriptional regulator [Lipingzhangella rawalii]|nr:helix-turn-helix domain-containing protein [Lipingzhangella rawalii]